MSNLKQIYLDKTNIERSDNFDYNLTKMRRLLHKKFDDVWVRYNNKKATIQEWRTALDKWLKAERM